MKKRYIFLIIMLAIEVYFLFFYEKIWFGFYVFASLITIYLISLVIQDYHNLKIAQMDFDIYFKIAMGTPFLESEIQEFHSLTDYSEKELIAVMKQFADNGIHSLHQIIIIVKLGHYRK